MSSLKFKPVKEKMGLPTKKDRNTMEKRAPKSLQQTFSLKAGPSHYMQSFKTWTNGGDTLPKGKYSLCIYTLSYICLCIYTFSYLSLMSSNLWKMVFEVIGMSKADLKQVSGGWQIPLNVRLEVFLSHVWKVAWFWAVGLM